VEKKYAGYFTIEAVLILPIVLFIIIFLIHLSFFQYNRCMLDEETIVMMLRGSNTRDAEKQKMSDEWKQNGQLIRRKKLFLIFNIETGLEIEGRKLHIWTEGAMKPIYQENITEDYLKNIWRISSERWVELYDPSGFLMECRKAEYFADRISE
jgi:hypothetical protein